MAHPKTNSLFRRFLRLTLRILLSLPILVLMVLYVGSHPDLGKPGPQPPQWTIPYTGTMESCSTIAHWDRFQVQDATDAHSAVSSDNASKTGRAVITRYYDFHGASGAPLTGVTPRLVFATFPDGQRRLAWVFGLLVSTRHDFMSANAAMVYLDANTGAPLLLLTDITVGDPSFTCPPIYGEDLIEAMTQGITTTLLAGYIGGILLFIGVRTLWRRRRKTTPARFAAR